MCFIWISWRKGCGYLCHPVFESTDEPEIDPAVCNQKGHPLYEKAAGLFENINAEYDKKTPGYEIVIKSYLLQLVAA